MNSLIQEIGKQSSESLQVLLAALQLEANKRGLIPKIPQVFQRVQLQLVVVVVVHLKISLQMEILQTITLLIYQSQMIVYWTPIN